MEDTILLLIQILSQYGYIIVFWGAFFGGDLVMLASVFLASLSVFNIYLVILFGLAGIVTSDNLWYLLGRKSSGQPVYFRRYSWFTGLKKYQSQIDFLKDKFAGNYGQFLIVSKFIYGVRIMTIIASGYQRLPYKRFFTFNLIGSSLWLVVIVFLGYIMGFSWNYLGQYSNYARYYALFGLLALFMLRYFFKKLLSINYYHERH